MDILPDEKDLSTLGHRIRFARKRASITQADLGAATGLGQGGISDLEAGRRNSTTVIATMARALNVSPLWLETGEGVMEVEPSNVRPSGFSMAVARDEDDGYFEIPYYHAKGSCGGGSHNFEYVEKGRLRKETSWFKHYKVHPEDVFTVYADGDSMSNFIVDGDMVIFDKTKTEPISGEIFLIKHPAGERIKQLRQEIDGTWVLESINPDKRKYPDERITPEQGELLVIMGKFVYRQGGW